MGTEIRRTPGWRRRGEYLVGVEVDPTTGCHNWTGTVNQDGYGLLARNGRSMMAHRWYWIQANGEIPDGLCLDHLCRNRLCCNPAHLEPVTNRANVMRGTSPTVIASREDRCVRGHPFTPANTIQKTDGSRQCRACQRAANNRSCHRKTETRHAALQP